MSDTFEPGRILQFVDLHRAASEALLAATVRVDNTSLLDESEAFGRRAVRAATNERQRVLANGLLGTVEQMRSTVES